MRSDRIGVRDCRDAGWRLPRITVPCSVSELARRSGAAMPGPCSGTVSARGQVRTEVRVRGLRELWPRVAA